MKYRQCNRCLMDTDECSDIKFDSNGCCNYCNDALKRKEKEYFPNNLGEHKLNELIAEIKNKCKNDEFDCLVGISGGIDSSYIMFLGHKFGLRMLAVHIDDGLDNPVAVSNIKKLVDATNTKMISIKPNKEEYSDIIFSLLNASVSNLAIAQDNLIIKALQDCAEKNNIKYMLDGSNFAHECILGRKDAINPCDKKFILGIHKKFGRIGKIKELQFMSLWDRYVKRHGKTKPKHIRPLNYINYNLRDAIQELHDFCGFEYYGGKHYESILTRFMQCYYLPTKFNIDKRKSHYSSLIISDQMKREEAVLLIQKPLYPNEKMLQDDISFICNYLNISKNDFNEMFNKEAKSERKFKHSILNELAPLARKFRKILE